MNQEKSQEKKYTRFYRDGVPYFDEFENVVSMLYSRETDKAEIKATLELMRNIQEHLGHCNKILGMSEQLVEDARAKNASEEEIDKLVSLCRELQCVQTNLSNSVVKCSNRLVDKIFPR